VHSLNAVTGDVMWAYETEAIMSNGLPQTFGKEYLSLEQLSFMAQGQNVTFYPDRRKGDIYTSLDGKSFVPVSASSYIYDSSTHNTYNT